jgi:phosphoenolpyruvate mutase
MKKVAYVSMSIDLVHPGHLRILERASKLGRVVVGLLTDAAVASYKRPPIMSYEQRREIICSIKWVDEVIPQDTLDYSINLEKLKPNFVVHGDDWREGVQRDVREGVIKTLAQWGGELIEYPYMHEISSKLISNSLREIGTTPGIRLGALRRLLKIKPLVKFLDIHNPLSALIVEHTEIEANGEHREFDGMWASSLTDATARGKPDIEAVDFSSRMMTLNEILEVTTKPIIFDADTGGQPEHFIFTVRSLERLGVSAVIIEDKTGLKKNSLFGNSVAQTQDSIENFSLKIQAGKKAQATSDFMIFARIESLILEKGIEDAISRAIAYINAGADGIMIHSRSSLPDEIFEFCNRYNLLSNRKPLVAVPSSYNQVTEAELIKHGVNIVIYANHLLRSAYPAMVNTTKSILIHQRSAECDSNLLPIKDILELIPGTK